MATGPGLAHRRPLSCAQGHHQAARQRRPCRDSLCLPRLAASRGGKSNDNGTTYNLFASCQSGVAVVDNTPVQNGVQDKDRISWIPIYPSQQVTVTTHNNMCTGGTNGVFTANQVCTVYGPPSTPGQPPILYTYEVKLDKCDGQGSGNLTINPPSSPPPPAQ